MKIDGYMVWLRQFFNDKLGEGGDFIEAYVREGKEGSELICMRVNYVVILPDTDW